MITLKNNAKHTVILLILIFMYLILIIFGDVSKSAALMSLKMCAQNIIPSLFPVIVFSNIISTIGLPNVHINQRLTKLKKLYNRKKNVLTLAAISLTGGYPLASVTSSKMLCEQIINNKQALCAAAALMSPGLTYTVIVTGEMLGSPKTGVMLFVCITLANITVYGAMCIALKAKRATCDNIAISPKYVFSDILISSVDTSVKSVISISAWIVLFNVIINIVCKLTGLKNTSLIILFAEITNTVSVLAQNSYLPVIAFFLAFGGICIVFQIMPMLKQINIKLIKFVLYRLICAALSYMYTQIACLIFPGYAYCSYFGSSVKLSQNSVSGVISLTLYCLFLIYSVSTTLEAKKINKIK